MDISELKTEIRISLKTDIAVVIKSELKHAHAEDFDFLKSELQTVNTEIINNSATFKSEIEHVKANIKEVEGGLLTWSDEVVNLQKSVRDLKAEMAIMKEKCEDLEGRMRRHSLRIVGDLESPILSSITSMSKMPMEM